MSQVAPITWVVSMRLWHKDLLKTLPNQWLLGQHRECCALRGNGWGKPHSTVNYVFEYSPYVLFIYHVYVMSELIVRGYNIDEAWNDWRYRGKNCELWNKKDFEGNLELYDEHNDTYIIECLVNLLSKGVNVESKLNEVLEVNI